MQSASTAETGTVDEGEVLPGSRSGRDPDRAIKPGRHGLTPERVAEIQRGRLLDGFVEMVAKHGFPDVTIGMVCEAAGVTKKTFYVFFPTMQDCFLAVHEAGSAIVFAEMERAYLAAGSVEDGVRAALGAMLRLLAAEPAFARVAVVEVNAAGARVRAARNDQVRLFRAFFTSPKYGVSYSVPEPLMDAVIGGIYSLIYMKVEDGETARLPELLPTLSYFAMLPLVGRENVRQ